MSDQSKSRTAKQREELEKVVGGKNGIKGSGRRLRGDGMMREKEREM